MKLVTKRREPEAIAVLIDDEASQLSELVTRGPIPRTSSKVDLGRSVFYMVAIDEYAEHIRNHALTPEFIAKQRAQIEADRVDPLHNPKGHLYAPLPVPEGTYVLALDEQRFNLVGGITTVEEVTWGKAMLNCAVHYFQSRA